MGTKSPNAFFRKSYEQTMKSCGPMLFYSVYHFGGTDMSTVLNEQSLKVFKTIRDHTVSVFHCYGVLLKMKNAKLKSNSWSTCLHNIHKLLSSMAPEVSAFPSIPYGRR